MPTKIKISPSSLDTLKQCPRKWYYRYIEKLYPKVQKDDAPVFGSFAHEIAENIKGDSLSDFKELVKNTLKKYDFGKYYKDKVVSTCKNIFSVYLRDISGKELVVNELDIDEPYKDIFYLKGKIDVLIANKNEIIILDWKTSKEVKDYSNQMAYYFFLLKKYGYVDLDQIKVKLVFLCPDSLNGDMEIEEFNLTLDEIEEAQRRVDESIQMYKHLGTDKIKWRKKVGPLCSYCDYYKAKICKGKDGDE